MKKPSLDFKVPTSALEPEIKKKEKKEKIKKDKITQQVNDALLPKNIWGKPICNEMTKDGKKKRIKHYLKDSLIFSLIMAVLDVIAIFITSSDAVFPFTISYFWNFVLTVLLTCLLLFIISFIVDYLVGEKSVKTHNKLKVK